MAAAAARDSVMESRSSEQRKAPLLPTPTATTVQSAREKANSVIHNTLNRISGNRHADGAQQGQETEQKMEVGNSPPHGQRGGGGSPSGGSGVGGGGSSASTDAAKAVKSGKAKRKSNNAADPAAAGTSQSVQDMGNGGAANSGMMNEPERVYKNLRRPSGDRDPDMRKTAKYDEIMIQRKIRGKHESVNSGPGVEGFDCGSFYMAGDNRSLYANMEESTNELLVSSTSFNRFNWECTSCDVRHDLLPLRHERYDWEGGRKLFIISDQNMPPMLPSKKGMCPAVLRIDGGHLRELGTTFLTILGRYAVPEGSVIMIGSLSHLMEEGRVGYAKALVTEQIRFGKAFKNTVHVVPFVPPPLCGKNDPDLMRAILDVAGWLEKAQKWKLPDYYADLKLHVITGGEGEDQQQFTTRQKLPKSLDAYNDRVYMCHPWDGLQTSLPPMAENTERELITSLLLNIGECFKWSLDPEPALTREFRQLPANSARAGQGAAALIIGGSNANRLTTAFTDLGKRVETISAGGWIVSRDSVDTLLPILRAKIDLLDPEAPVILWCMDSLQTTDSLRRPRGHHQRGGWQVSRHWPAYGHSLQSAPRYAGRAKPDCGCLWHSPSDDTGSGSPLSHQVMLHGHATLCKHQGSGLSFNCSLQEGHGGPLLSQHQGRRAPAHRSGQDGEDGRPADRQSRQPHRRLHGHSVRAMGLGHSPRRQDRLFQAGDWSTG